MGFLAVVLTIWCVFTGQVTSIKRVHLNDGQRFQLQLIHLANDVMGLQEMQVSYFLKQCGDGGLSYQYVILVRRYSLES